MLAWLLYDLELSNQYGQDIGILLCAILALEYWGYRPIKWEDCSYNWSLKCSHARAGECTFFATDQFTDIRYRWRLWCLQACPQCSLTPKPPIKSMPWRCVFSHYTFEFTDLLKGCWSWNRFKQVLGRPLLGLCGIVSMVNNRGVGSSHCFFHCRLPVRI